MAQPAPDDIESPAARVFLVADIRGYTAYTARHGDLAASRLAERLAIIVGEGVTAWTGTLVELRGDEALAAFDDPQAALWAAVELQDAFAHESALHPAHPLPVGMGLDIGEAVPLGEGFRGRALNLAARLCGVSRAGEIHVSAELVARANGLLGVEFEPVDGLELKGFGHDVLAYKLIPGTRVCRTADGSPPETREPPQGMPAGLETEHALSGRQAEFRWLRWHWRRARYGHGGVVHVGGPAGSGKTRLVAELAALALADGAWVSYRGANAPGSNDPRCPEARTRRAGLVILDAVGSGDPSTVVPAGLEDQPCLAVVVGRATVEGPGNAWPAEPLPSRSTLELGPLDLAGLREMAVNEAPDVVDELPLGRILDRSKGLPAQALEAIDEWSARVEAERAAARPEALAPTEGSSFIGRVQELAVAGGLLGQGHLLTLVGPPGTGKTRLAQRLFRERGSDYPGGSWFVHLHAIRDPALLGSAIAHVLGLRESAEAAALDVVKAYLADREALLVLDNFEQLIDAAGVVAGISGSAPGLTMVVTSRTSLGVTGEQLFPVPPMSLPPVDGRLGAESVQTYDSVALFEARARSVDPDFELDDTNAETIARIAARLEGLPLALELAAARVHTLTPAELLEHLDRRLPMLTSARSAPDERHRTMRGAIAWSYELLPEHEQALLRQLAVFRGGFTLESAARLTTISKVELIDGLGSLVTQSLLTRVPTSSRSRYALLELIREFAVDELVAHEELADATERHARAFLKSALGMAPALEGDGAPDALALLIPEVDNIRAALEHAMAVSDAELGLRLSASVWRLWQSIGQLAEGREWLARSLCLDGGGVVDRANAHAAIAGLAYWQGDFPAARQHYLQARGLFASVDDQVEEANATYCLSLVATLEGQLDTAEQYADEALAVFRELDLEGKVGEVLMARFTVAWRKGQLDAARSYAEEAVAISLGQGNRGMAASQLVGVAGIAFEQGDTATAVDRAAEALELAIEVDNTHTQLFALDALASFTAAVAPVAAVRLSSAASTLRDEHGGGWTLETFGVESAREVAAARLPAQEAEAAWLAGTGLDLEAAIEIARSIVEQGASQMT